jgi:hypothetical protein
MGGPLEGLVGGLVGGPVACLFDKYFWCALAFVTPAQATSYICACTENMGDCLSLYSQEILFFLNKGTTVLFYLPEKVVWGTKYPLFLLTA